MAEKKFGTRARIHLIILIAASLLSACNLSSGSNLLFDFLGGNQNEVQEEQNQNQADQDQVEDEEQNQDVLGEVQGHEADWIYNKHGGMALWYDPEVILEIRAGTIRLSEGGPGEVPHPAYVQYSLPLDSGMISMVEIEAYTDMAEAADQIFPELRDLLANRNALSLDCIPELPLLALYRQCSHQQFNANVEYIDFKNGTGVRFVTVYGIQDAVPVSNEHLVYVYQGITQDRQCYVTASFKLNHEDLEDYGEISRDIYSDMTGIGLAEYFSEHEQLLEDNLVGYMPGLERFDQIMQSIEVAYCFEG